MYPYFSLFSWKIPAYGTMMMLGLLVASLVGMYRVRRAGLLWEDALVLVVCGFGCAILGAATLYIAVTYSMHEIIEMMKTGELFTGESVGLVFYGGLLGCIPGVILGTRLTRVKLSEYIPAMVPCIPLGHAFGRIGCLLAGCCYGRPVEGWMGIVYPSGTPGVPEGVRLFPVQALESALLLAIFAVLVKYSAGKRTAKRIVGLYFLLYASCRFFLEELRYDAVRGHWGPCSTSQWISIGMIAVGAVLWILPRLRRGEYDPNI